MAANHVNITTGFDLDLPRDDLKAGLIVSLLSVWVLIGLFLYLNRYTRRRYFTIWNAGWLFYALWVTLNLSFQVPGDRPWLEMLEHGAIATSAVCLLWGSARFLDLPAPQLQCGLFLAFVLTWSYVGAYHLESRLQAQVPIFGLIGVASLVTGYCFFRFRLEKHFIGAGLLGFGFCLWGGHLIAYPFIQTSDELIASNFFISAVLQLFIAVSMIVLVLEEAKRTHVTTLERIKEHQSEKAALRTRATASEERYRYLFEHASEGIVLADSTTLNLLEANTSARRILGLALNQPLHDASLSHFLRIKSGPDERPASGAEWLESLANHRQFTLIARDGRQTVVEVEGGPIAGGLDGVPACQFFLREVTERTRLERQLRQNEKLAALGQMIAGVAHELNNPLAVIRGYAELIINNEHLSKTDRANLEKIAHEAGRAGRLINGLRSFARQRSLNPCLININDFVRRIIDLRQFDLKNRDIEVNLNLELTIPQTMVDPDQIQQVFMNLLDNSLDAMATTGKPGRIRYTTRARAGEISILFEDNGPGVPEDVLPHIFEPFFTTKPVGVGTGLGLSIAHSILMDHRGRIFYQPSALGGAAFSIDIPITTTAPETRDAAEEIGHSQIGKPADAKPGRILILDDESAISELFAELLGKLGYSTFPCNCALRALELIEIENFDLILSDYRMPEMDGKEFYEAAIKLKPKLKDRIVFVTGEIENDEISAFLGSVGTPRISKPFHLAKVQKVVAELLASRS